MLKTSVLGHSALVSSIGEASILNPQGEAKKRNVIADLLLTALIDAFSILVIFLLMSFSSTGELLFMGKNMELPKAAQGIVLERSAVVKVDQGKIYVEDQEVSPEQLTGALLEIRKKFQETRPGEEFPAQITVQADRRVKYEMLNSIVLASSQAGISDIKFAIIMK
ncbi:MAG: biopolymer transporter ExbD [Proteobacteria bacterium]|jgi:biopolymer transport protein ExbD|nr:biopolymer transporter ExbD [Pseudomonadota bacterium]